MPEVNAFEMTEAIDRIVELANHGAAARIEYIDRPFADGGLPEKVPALYDPQLRKLLPVKDVLEAYRTGPDRKRGVAVADTFQSFVDLVNRHKTGDSALFGRTEWPAPALTAVIDYHKIGGGETDPGMMKHLVRYPFPVTQEFKDWVEGDGQKMTQVDFATFLEDHISDMAAPEEFEVLDFRDKFRMSAGTPADIIQVSRSLQVTVGQAVKNSFDPRTGAATFTFSEEHQTGKGTAVDVPGGFILSMAPFRSGPKVRIVARLRYRVVQGAVVWSYHLWRWQEAVEVRVSGDLLEVGRQTGLPTFLGRPES